jgi:hypothetical protein
VPFCEPNKIVLVYTYVGFLRKVIQSHSVSVSTIQQLFVWIFGLKLTENKIKKLLSGQHKNLLKCIVRTCNKSGRNLLILRGGVFYMVNFAGNRIQPSSNTSVD